jgi:PLP dependent protein
VKSSPGGSLSRVLERIETAARRAGRDPKSVRLVVVTKGVPLQQIRESVSTGDTILGENRIQEALPKIQALGEGVTWHLIGSLQRNKARDAVGLFELIHSVDRKELARELDRRSAQKGIIQKVLIQVNVAGESAKHGVVSERAEELVKEVVALPHLQVQGLMTIPPLPSQPEDSRDDYKKLYTLSKSIEKGTGIMMTELSMGMSRDFEVAIEEGSTMVRVGTAIFAPSSLE